MRALPAVAAVRGLLAASVLLLVAMPGCLVTYEETTTHRTFVNGVEVTDHDGDRVTGVSTRTYTTELGHTSGDAIAPGGRFPFEATVPEGGARNVRWQMTVEGPGAGSLSAHVEGPGCDGASGLALSGFGTTTYSGTCKDLGAGRHAFTAVVDLPAVTFDVVLSGSITVTTTF